LVDNLAVAVEFVGSQHSKAEKNSFAAGVPQHVLTLPVRETLELSHSCLRRIESTLRLFLLLTVLSKGLAGVDAKGTGFEFVSTEFIFVPYPIKIYES
jgi:hypothetical protein